MAVFGFIDRAVVDETDLAPRVAELLPAYGQGAAGWYDGVAEWIPEALQVVRASSKRGSKKQTATAGSKSTATARAVEPPIPDVKEALANFASLPDDQLLEDGLAGRQLLALTVLGRIWPTIASTHSPLSHQLAAADVEPKDLAQALVPLTTDRDEASAGKLLNLLVGPQGHPGVPWEDLLNRAVNEGLIKPSVANSQCTPCGFIVKKATTGPAVAFLTHKRIVGVTMADFDDLFDPTKWTNFSPPWCAMTPEAPIGGHDVYLEQLSIDCAADPSPTFSLNTPLEFLTGQLPDLTGQVLQYRLPPDWSTYQGGDGLVSVDEGSIVVRKWKGAIHLITTKRIQFRVLNKMPPLEAAWIAQFVWAVGYTALADYFVNRVCHLKQAQVTEGPGSAQIKSHHHPDPSPFKQLDKIWKQEVAECVDGIDSSLGELKKGDYGPGEYADDLGKFVKHVAHYGSELLSIAAGLGGAKEQSKTKKQSKAKGASGKGTYVSEALLISGSPALVVGQATSLALECSTLQPGLMQSASEEIAAQIVTCDPAQLGPTDEYRLVVEEKSLQLQPGGTYTGTVQAVTAPGMPAGSSQAWIVIP